MSHNGIRQITDVTPVPREPTVRAEPSSCGNQPAYISLTPPSLTNDRRITD